MDLLFTKLKVSSMPTITNIEFRAIELNHKNGLVVTVRGDAPPGNARVARSKFWEASKRLPLGGLVALVTKKRGLPATVSLAILTTCESWASHDPKFADHRSARYQACLSI
jgi:hypothetical protein